MLRFLQVFVVVTIILLGSLPSNGFSVSLSDEETPADWAVKWNGIGKSNNPAHEVTRSWKGISISKTEKTRLLSKIQSQPATEVYAGLLARPSSTVSNYGTCMVGIVQEMPTFWVSGMYGSIGQSGYPKNPESGDGTGHLQGCYNEHQITGLCSFSDVAERAKQTLLYAVQNDVCTNYYSIKQLLEDVSLAGKSKRDVQTSANQYLKQVGLTIPPSGKGEKWITLCEVKARVRYSGFSRRYDVQSCQKTARGEIKEVRVKVKAEWSCSYKTELFTSGTRLSYQNRISHQYDDGIKLAIEKGSKLVVDFMQTMKRQHMENLQVSTDHDTAKLIATAESAPFWGPGANCDLVLEGRVNELY